MYDIHFMARPKLVQLHVLLSFDFFAVHVSTRAEA